MAVVIWTLDRAGGLTLKGLLLPTRGRAAGGAFHARRLGVYYSLVCTAFPLGKPGEVHKGFLCTDSSKENMLLLCKITTHFSP